MRRAVCRQFIPRIASLWPPPPTSACFFTIVRGSDAGAKTQQRSLDVAVVGAPNAGKSSLVNRLVDFPVSAVSRKYNTTRRRVLGISTDTATGTQLVYYDTPGFVAEGGTGKYRFVSELVTTARDTVKEAEAVLFVLDVAKRFEDDAVRELKNVVATCAKNSIHVFLVANKVDHLQGDSTASLHKPFVFNRDVDFDVCTESPSGAEKVVSVADARSRSATSADRPLWDKLALVGETFQALCKEHGLLGSEGFRGARKGQSNAHGNGATATVASVYSFVPPVFATCARTGRGVHALKAALTRLALPRPWEYPPHQRSLATPEEQVEEAVREGLLLYLHEEMPYAVRQITRKLEVTSEARPGSQDATPTGVLQIEQDILVPNSRVAGILLGKGAAKLRDISAMARSTLQSSFGRPVHLRLHVTTASGGSSSR